MERASLRGSGTTAARHGRGRAGWKTALASSTAIAALLLAVPLKAQVTGDPTNLFGSRGMIATPSARMAPDGELSVGASFFRNNQHYSMGFQILPWLEGSFRYSGLQRFNPDYPVYFDRAFGMKARLWDEIGIIPAVALGIDDLVGTGVYNGEYIVASKRFGSVDTSFGMGWGRRASSGLLTNPLRLVIPSFKDRPSFQGQAGGAQFEAFFRGAKVGLFGGAVWQTPLTGLSVMVEYDSDVYADERGTGNLNPKSQVNYGLAYDVSRKFSVGLSWLYGTTLGANFSFHLDPVREQYPMKLGEPPPPVEVRTDLELQALAEIPRPRDPANAQKRRFSKTRYNDSNAFVDALWHQSGDLVDIQIRRNILEMTVTGTISSTRCADVTRLMRGADAGITLVQLRDKEGRRSVSCMVPSAANTSPVSAVLFMPILRTLPTAEVLTIDATAVLAKRTPGQAERAIRAAAKAQHIQIAALRIGEDEALVYYTNTHYAAEADAVERLTRILTREAPPEIEKFRLIAVRGSTPLQVFSMMRRAVERASVQTDDHIFDGTGRLTPPPLNNPVLAAALRDDLPRFSWFVSPQFRQALFDPVEPFAVQFLVSASALLEVAPGVSLVGAVEASLYDQFNTGRISDSFLPHVRSDFIKYHTEGKIGIGQLRGDYRFRLTPEVFGAVRAGYLESMFAGVGGEVLWRPEGQRWALGVDAYQVEQREFNRLFGLRDYRQFTGHVTVYYDSPWYGLNFQARAGQYLAGDRGLTLQVTRRFATGVEVGAFLTRTNVSAAQFGEGSFDKGIVIRIPLGWIVPLETQRSIAMDMRPVQRDGGQALAGDATLYEETRATSKGELLRKNSNFATTW